MSNLSDTKKSNNSEQNKSEKYSKPDASNRGGYRTNTTSPRTAPSYDVSDDFRQNSDNCDGATSALNGKSNRWGFIKSDLSDALNAWEELEKAEVALSPEEEQLVKIKSIITQLTDKLNQF